MLTKNRLNFKSIPPNISFYPKKIVGINILIAIMLYIEGSHHRFFRFIQPSDKHALQLNHRSQGPGGEPTPIPPFHDEGGMGDFICVVWRAGEDGRLEKLVSSFHP